MFGKRKDTIPEVVLTPHRIVGNLLYGAGGDVTAWFLLPTQRWAFLTQEPREALVTAFTGRMSLLAGYHVHMRITTVPFRAADWARNLEAVSAPSAGHLQGYPEGHPFKRWLAAQQRRVQTATTDEKVIYIGVQLRARRTRTSKVGETVGLGSGLNEAALKREAEEIADYVAGDGFGGRPCTQADIEWLLRRSVGLGMYAPKRTSPVGEEVPWEPEDMPEITDGVCLEAERFAPYVKVTRTDTPDGTPQVRYVATLTLGRIERVQVGPVPWLTVTDRFPWPIEWSIRWDILDGHDARSAIGKKLLMVQDMKKHYDEHGMTEPLKLDRQIKRAREADDEMTSGNPLRATRAHGWLSVAVSADTPEKVMQRAAKITDAYRNIQMTMVHSYGMTSAGHQHALATSFVPSMPLASRAHVRRAPIKYFAIGMPTASTTLGDNRGAYIGYTGGGGGGRRAVFFDTHYSTEVLRRAGLYAIAAELGGGKSGLGGHAFIVPSVMRGIPTFVWDPSGPLARLCQLPAFEGRAREIPLGSQAPGTLSPFGVVPEPRSADYDGDAEKFEFAKADAASMRRQLAVDTIVGLLPPELAGNGRARLAVQGAVKLTGGVATASLWTVIEFLKGEHGVGDKFGDIGLQMAEFLEDVATMPLARLLFPSMSSAAPKIDDDDYLLTVITMQGVVLPPRGVERAALDPSMQITLPVLQLATWLTARGIYSGPMGRRKTVLLDEVHFLSDWPAGRALFNRLARDNRKWNTCVAALSQTPDDILGMGDAATLLAGAFVGLIEDEDTARRALKLLRMREDSGYEQAIMRLGRGPEGERQFVFRDPLGRVDMLNVDISHTPDVLEALDTNADQPLMAPRAPGSDREEVMV